MPPRSLEYFRTRQRTEPDWIIPGWLKRGNTGFIIGQPKKACKSWLLLWLAWWLGNPNRVGGLWGIEHSKDGPQFVPSRPMHTVYFAQEDTEDDIQDRTDAFFRSGQPAHDSVRIVPKDLDLALDDTGIRGIRRELDAAKSEMGSVDLVIFDPMRRLHRGNENDSQVIAALWHKLDAIHNNYLCSTLFAHHVVKPPKDPWAVFDDTSPFSARGSGDIYGGGDAFIVVRTPKGYHSSETHRWLELHFETKRAATPRSVLLFVNTKTGTIAFEDFVGEAGKPKGRPRTEKV